MSRCLLVSSFALFMVACYAGAPPRPAPVPLPPLSDEAELHVVTRQRIDMETQKQEERTCPADVKDKDSSKCTVTTRDVTAPVAKTLTAATLGPDAISYAQFQVLTDPTYKDKLARLDELRSRCRHADVPRWIGMSMMLGGLVTTLVGAAVKGPVIASVGGGTFAGGIGSYVIGYYRYNGDDCRRASALYDAVEFRGSLGLMEAEGEARAVEMKALAAEFNQRRRVQSATKIEAAAAVDDSGARDSADPPPPPSEAASDEPTATEARVPAAPQ